MHPFLEDNEFFIRKYREPSEEGVYYQPVTTHYDIYDRDSRYKLMECRQQDMGTLTNLLDFTNLRGRKPFQIDVHTPDHQRILRIKKERVFNGGKIDVLDESMQEAGHLHAVRPYGLQKNLQAVCLHKKRGYMLKKDVLGWNFHFYHGGLAMAHMKRKWAQPEDRWIPSTDNFILTINPVVKKNDPVRQLIFASLFCIGPAGLSWQLTDLLDVLF